MASSENIAGLKKYKQKYGNQKEKNLIEYESTRNRKLKNRRVKQIKEKKKVKQIKEKKESEIDKGKKVKQIKEKRKVKQIKEKKKSEIDKGKIGKLNR